MNKFLTFLKKIFEGLLYEQTENNQTKFSIGRLFLFVLFISAMIVWLGGSDIPGTMLTVLLTFVGYNMGSKALTAIEKIVIKK